jgi:dsRNA-specific ribonuclease
MRPATMLKKAQQTAPLRQNMEDVSNYGLKIFGDVFEALVAAVFLDTGGDIGKT